MPMVVVVVQVVVAVHLEQVVVAVLFPSLVVVAVPLPSLAAVVVQTFPAAVVVQTFLAAVVVQTFPAAVAARVLVVLVLVVAGQRQRGEVQAVGKRQQVAAAVGQALVVLVLVVAGKRQREVQAVQAALVGKRQQVVAAGQALVVLAGKLRREAVVACLQQHVLHLSSFVFALVTLDLEVVPTNVVGSAWMLEAFLRVCMAKVQRRLAGEAAP